MTLVPAYGRDYTSKKAVLLDWQSGKDFIINDFFDPYDGTPISVYDADDRQQYTIRFKQLRNIAIVYFKGGWRVK